MQKERVDYFNSDSVTISVLATKEAFPLARYGGLSEFNCADTDYIAWLSMNGKTKTAQKIYEETLVHWGFDLAGNSVENQRWNTALSKAGLS